MGRKENERVGCSERYAGGLLAMSIIIFLLVQECTNGRVWICVSIDGRLGG